MTDKKRAVLAREAIVWAGDLDDDCHARWAGLLLRAEWMDEDYWWWAVYDMEKNEITIDASYNYDENFIGGEISRKKAEDVARQYLVISGIISDSDINKGNPH